MKEFNDQNLAKTYKSCILKDDFWQTVRQFFSFGYLSQTEWDKFNILIKK